jgi:antitoxin PrlF
MKTIAKITSKGQITIPLEIRKLLGVQNGDYLEFTNQGTSIQVKPQQHENPFRQFRGAERIKKGKTLQQIITETQESRGWKP